MEQIKIKPKARITNNELKILAVKHKLEIRSYEELGGWSLCIYTVLNMLTSIGNINNWHPYTDIMLGILMIVSIYYSYVYTREIIRAKKWKIEVETNLWTIPLYVVFTIGAYAIRYLINFK